MQIIEKVYNMAVNQNPEISLKYQRYRKRVSGAGRMNAWLYLIGLNIQYGVFKGKSTGSFLFDDFYENKKLNSKQSESAAQKINTPKELVQKLAQYDVISFDVFDTLVFRPFSEPGDLFHMVGQKLEYMDFARIRMEMEEKSRNKKQKLQENREVTFEDIWSMMEQETGIPKDTGMKTEWECEKNYCFGNSYMLEVVRELQKLGKKMIVVSDMYLGQKYIQELLKHCGYPEFTSYFVSCDYEESKNQGKLYDIVKQKIGEKFTYIHVGDNKESDIKQARQHQFDTFYYPNVNEKGRKYRAEDMSAIIGSMYRGLVDVHLHCGTSSYSKAYEFGFVYGGLFVLGYCKWIHDWAEKNEADKILFLARDGDILSKVYSKMYPQEQEKQKWNYVYWSRLAAVKMSANYYKYDYFRRFLYHKVNQNYTMNQIFASMELEDMLPKMKNYKGDTLLTDKNVEAVKVFLQKHWDEVLKHYEEQIAAGKAYYEPILKGCKRVAAVDVGWAGSGAIALNYIANHIWNLNCEIIGLIAGSNSIHSYEPDASQGFFFEQKLDSYMFSQTNNRDAWKIHNPGKGHNVIVELLLCSEAPSFRGFTNKAEKYIFCEKSHEINVQEVQKGILDFADIFRERIGTIPEISGRDAFAPIELLYKNEAWLEDVMSLEKFKMNLE